MKSVRVVFSLPLLNSNRVFIAAADGDENLMRRVIANLQEESLSRTVELGQVLLLRDAELECRDICGVIFLPIGTSNLLNYLPDKLDISGREYRFLLVVLLGSREHELWRRGGHDSLMDHFQASGKDLIAMPPKVAHQ
jgi:hypothetical protein